MANKSEIEKLSGVGLSRKSFQEHLWESSSQTGWWVNLPVVVLLVLVDFERYFAETSHRFIAYQHVIELFSKFSTGVSKDL